MKKTPNILFIFSDQHRYDCVGHSNAYPVKTPNIDKLANEGIWFSNAFTPIPLCCPARQSLLNGRRPESFGSLWNYGITLQTAVLEPDDYSWPKALKENGYQNGYIGKWHVNQKYDPTYFGFDDYIALDEHRKYLEDKYPDVQKKPFVKKTSSYFGHIDSVCLEDSRTHWQADKVIEMMEEYQKKGTPWHIRLDFNEPHPPYCPVEEFARMYSPEDIPKWKSFDDTFENKPYIQKQQVYNWNVEKMSWEDWAPVVARYYGIISQMDDAVGKVMNALETMGIADDTIVIYTTDHGDMCGGHKMMDKLYVLYDDIVHVPFIIRWKGTIKPGMECNEFVYNCLDLPPTILEILGIQQPDFFHGRSLMPLIQDEKVDDWRQEAVSTYNGMQFGAFNQRMIRDNHFKYIWNTTDIDELYDLEKDPGELTNLIVNPEYRDLISNMRKKLFKVLSKEGDGLFNSWWLESQLLNDRKL